MSIFDLWENNVISFSKGMYMNFAAEPYPRETPQAVPKVAYYTLYRVYTHADFGYFGPGKHVYIPACALECIQELHSDQKG